MATATGRDLPIGGLADDQDDDELLFALIERSAKAEDPEWIAQQNREHEERAKKEAEEEQKNAEKSAPFELKAVTSLINKRNRLDDDNQTAEAKKEIAKLTDLIDATAERAKKYNLTTLSEFINKSNTERQAKFKLFGGSQKPQDAKPSAQLTAKPSGNL